jgi:hypothetical protein
MNNETHVRRSPYPAASSPEGMRIPVLVTYLHPFRLVQRDPHEKWSATIEEVNSRSWDYVRLHELVGGIDVGLESPAHMVVGFDGVLALPLMPEFREVEKAVSFFNRHLAAILLGGIYCEAIGLEDVDSGEILNWEFVRTAGHGSSMISQFHHGARTRHVSPIHSISLISPRYLPLSQLVAAHQRGGHILAAIPELTPEFLLRGVSAMARRDWSAALSNVWIGVEQLTAHLWKREILGSVEAGGSGGFIKGRREQLADVRTWTTAHRQEMLLERGALDHETLADLFSARQARNHLVHRGEVPKEGAARSAFAAFRGLIERSVIKAPIALFEIDLADHELTAPFEKRENPGKPTHWISLPELPGEKEIIRQFAEFQRQKGTA